MLFLLFINLRFLLRIMSNRAFYEQAYEGLLIFYALLVIYSTATPLRVAAV